MLRFALLSLLATVPLLAQSPYSISPSSGPTTGGTRVTIKGDFAASTFGVLFGTESASAVTLVDEHTITAITPPHLPGSVHVHLFELDAVVSTGLTFDYVGDPPAEFERVLLPVFAPPVFGAFGSEFHTALRIMNSGTAGASVYGLEQPCFGCPPVDPGEQPFDVPAGVEIAPNQVAYTGNPALFLWAGKNAGADLSMNLRVHDVTRSDVNFGTEIPVVRENDWVNDHIVLTGVPTDSRFRNTLRIYGKAPFQAVVTIGNRAPVHLTLSAVNGVFEVPYAVWGDFPRDVGPVRVTIESVPNDVPMWAMITVTNNETQLISTITPQN